MSPTSDVAMLRTVMQPIAFSWGSGHPNQNGFRTIENGQKNMKYLPLGPTHYSDMLFQPVSTATWMMCYDVANPAGYPRYDWHQEVCKTRTLRLARSYPQEERNRHGDAWGPFRSVWCLEINFHLGKKTTETPCKALDLILYRSGKFEAINTSQSISRMNPIYGKYAPFCCLTPEPWTMSCDSQGLHVLLFVTQTTMPPLKLRPSGKYLMYDPCRYLTGCLVLHGFNSHRLGSSQKSIILLSNELR